MKFAGWVPYRRGIIEHVLDGRLTGHEHYALSQLILLADSSTGGYTVNAPVLAYFCGNCFGQDTAARILSKLHERGYVWYRGVPHSKKVQPYWVNNYLLTAGPMKMRITRLSQLRDKSTVSQQDVWTHADQRADQSKDQTEDHVEDQAEDNNKKEKIDFENRELTPLTTPSIRVKHSKIASLAASLNASQTASKPASMDEARDASRTHHECVTPASLNASPNAPCNQYADTRPLPIVPIRWGERIRDYEFIPNEGYRDNSTGQMLRTFAEIVAVTEKKIA